MADNDPFAKYGGAAIAPVKPASDPFFKYGGAALANTVPAAPAARPHLGSTAADVLSTVGQHALNSVVGPAKTILQPPQNTGEKIANYAMPGGLAAYRTLVEPSIAPVKQAIHQVGQGDFSGAARSAESAIPVVGPWADQVENDVKNKGAVAGLAGLATDVLAPKAVGKVVSAVPDALQTSARGVIKQTVGLRGKDFSRGANPADAYLRNGLGPSGSMESIADKAGDARAEAGQALGNAYAEADKKGTLIPADTVRKAIGDILTDAKAKAGAPGVVADPAVYDQMAQSFVPALKDAYAKGGFTPSELWKIRKDMNESLNWGDQSRLNVTKTQQRVSGALGGVLEDAVPAVADLNQNYQDLSSLHERSVARAQSSPTLGQYAGKAALGAIGGAAGHIMGGPGSGIAGGIAAQAADSIPVKTTLASGIYGAGRVLRPVGQAATAAALPQSLAAVAVNKQAEDGSEESSNNGADDSQATPSAESITPTPAPDTHSFSTSEWIKSNPDGDPDEAKEEAVKQGYTVTD